MSRLKKSDVIGMLQEHGAIVSGHFEMLSGLHSSTFIRTTVVLQYPNMATKLAESICVKFPEAVDVVLAPSAPAVVLTQEVARLKRGRAVSVGRTASGMSLRRGFQLNRGERVLIVQDVITTGRSTSEAVSLALAYGAKVIGVGAIVDRSTSPLPLRVPLRPLVCYPTRVDTAETCPLCARSIPLTHPLGESESPL